MSKAFISVLGTEPDGFGFDCYSVYELLSFLALVMQSADFNYATQHINPFIGAESGVS